MFRKFALTVAFLTIFAGIGILMYPAVSNLTYEREQKELVSHYEETAQELPPDMADAELKSCTDYNDSLRDNDVVLTDPFDETQLDPSAHPYTTLLNPNRDGGMGVIEIPSIGVSLMIYHGTSEEILQKGVGHLQGSSLPVGGTGTHSVLSAHTGLQTKKLFTDLDKLRQKDRFYLHILGETLAYEVDQIKVVLPNETDALMIDSGQDYVTLITCTPYGVNSHRLLVRGTRIPYTEEDSFKEPEKHPGRWQDTYRKAASAGVVLAAGLFFAAVHRRRKRRKKIRRRRYIRAKKSGRSRI